MTCFYLMIDMRLSEKVAQGRVRDWQRDGGINTDNAKIVRGKCEYGILIDCCHCIHAC